MTKRRREALILKHIDLARAIAHKVARRLPRYAMAREELDGEALLLLVEGVDAYKPSLGVPIAAWLRQFIGWRIRDMCRRKPLRDATHAQLDEEIPRATSEPSPEEVAERTERAERVRTAMATLGEREQKILAYRYYRELTFREIGPRVGLKDSRVCQLHAEASAQVRTLLEEAA